MLFMQKKFNWTLIQKSIPVERQRLIFQGRELKDANSLQEFGKYLIFFISYICIIIMIIIILRCKWKNIAFGTKSTTKR